MTSRSDSNGSSAGGSDAGAAQSSGDPLLRPPTADDGYAVHQLIAACPPLDPNSVYCNLLQCSHFADTSVAVELDGGLAGFISGYIPPRQPDTLFIWQVAVSGRARGLGLGKRMLRHLLERPACSQVCYLDTTVTADNAASWGMFRSLARDLGADCRDAPHFERERHFGGDHDDEYLLRIGPFPVQAASS